MDRSDGWQQDPQERRPWTQGPWHGAPEDQGSASRGRAYQDPPGQGTWQQDPRNAGPAFGESIYGFGDGAYGDLAAATAAARNFARRVVRFLLLFVVGGFALGAGLIALAVAAWPHSALAVLLVLLAVPVLFVSLVTATGLWFGRRAWRSGTWTEAVPAATGSSWLSRARWAIRAALGGKASRRRGRRKTYQARAGDLSGTTR